MSTATTASAPTAPTEFLRVKDETRAYRRIGGGFRRPLLCLQHFTGTLDNWDPAVTDSSPLLALSQQEFSLSGGPEIGT
jgi:hypothetical protein